MGLVARILMGCVSRFCAIFCQNNSVIKKKHLMKRCWHRFITVGFLDRSMIRVLKNLLLLLVSSPNLPLSRFLLVAPPDCFLSSYFSFSFTTFVLGI